MPDRPIKHCSFGHRSLSVSAESSFQRHLTAWFWPQAGFGFDEVSDVEKAVDTSDVISILALHSQSTTVAPFSCRRGW